MILYPSLIIFYESISILTTLETYSPLVASVAGDALPVVFLRFEISLLLT